MGFATIQTNGTETKLFALAEKVKSAEKAFHDALLCRNEAQIAYLRDPTIMTLQSLEKSKTAEAVALEILDTGMRLPSMRATTVIGLKLKASYASTDTSSPTASSGTFCDFKTAKGDGVQPFPQA